MVIFSYIISFFLVIKPSPFYQCDGDLLSATIRNNLNGDFALTNDLDEIDEGAFVILNWKDISLMLPVSFQVGEISFTDKKWLWSYKDPTNGLHKDNPRFSQRLPSGKLIEHECTLPEVISSSEVEDLA